jgi:hypothetical protein
LISSLLGFKRAERVEFDEEVMKDFEMHESKSYRYKIRPKRFIAGVDITGEVTPDKIANSITLIRNAVASRSRDIIPGKVFELAVSSDNNMLGDIGLQLFYTKACFNPRAEPAMAIYEMQFIVKEYRKTRIFLDVISK